jgi:hypothetical protein
MEQSPILANWNFLLDFSRPHRAIAASIQIHEQPASEVIKFGCAEQRNFLGSFLLSTRLAVVVSALNGMG